MILVWIKNLSLLVVLNLLVLSTTLAADRLSGQDIKEQSAEYFTQQGLKLSLVVSDKRSFFPCSVPLDFRQRYENDWSTVLVRCSHENWETFIRSISRRSTVAFQREQMISTG